MWKSVKKNILPAFLISVSLTALHYGAHMLIHPYLSADQIPFVISLIISVAYYIIEMLLKRNKMQALRFATLVGLLHLAAHYVSSSVLGLNIIASTVIGIAGATVLVTVFLLELFRKK